MRRQFEKSTPLDASAKEVFDWHMRPGALWRLSPPWQPVEVIGSAGTPKVGDRVTLRLGSAPFRVTWVASHTEVEEGRGFEDIQIEGPFHYWKHRHRFEATNNGLSVLQDSIEYELPMGSLGSQFGDGFVRKSLESTFAYRHETTRRDLDFHRSYETLSRLKVAITGASGLIGSSLSAFLSTGGHKVIPIVRRRVSDDECAARWAPEVGAVDLRKLEGVDAVVHLAGENISQGRWTSSKKDRIRESRVGGTRNLLNSLSRLNHPPRIFLTASAVGYYGDQGDDPVDESSSQGQGFLAAVCRDWEQAAFEGVGAKTRAVAARFGVVVTPQGGALAKMLPVFRVGGGGNLGNGRQFMSWISIDDAVGALTHLLLTPEVAGPVDLVSPSPVRNSEFTKTLARVLKRPAIAPLPSPMARLLFGQMADETLLASIRALPTALTSSGFLFRDPDLEPTLRRLLGR
jgi:uncharacterized protein (TIGR01777 family)